MLASDTLYGKAMKIRTIRFSALTLALIGGAFTAIAQDNWPSFRGPFARGFAEGIETPDTWDIDTRHNIRWITPIPGLGHSSPIVWGNRIYVTTAESDSPDPELRVGIYGDIAPVKEEVIHRWHLLCIDKSNGNILWDAVEHQAVPSVHRHPKASHANSTPATDGTYIVAILGSEGLFCFDMSGELVWEKKLGALDAGFWEVRDVQWGYGSSPVIHDGKVVVQCDVLSQSFLAAYRLEDGKRLWRKNRGDEPTWGTPTIHKGPRRTQVIVNGWKRIGGYNLKNGRSIWRLRGGGDIPIPTPVVSHGLIFITNAHGGNSPLYAIRSNARGNITREIGSSKTRFLAWHVPTNGAYIQTPLIYRDCVYSSKDNGVLKCYDVASGEEYYEERLGEGQTGFTPSPVASSGKVYFTSENGDVLVLRSGPEFEVIATNSLGEICMATPAISEGMLIVRARSNLFGIAESSEDIDP